MTNREKLKELLDTNNNAGFARYFGCRLCVREPDIDKCFSRSCQECVLEWLESEAENE